MDGDTFWAAVALVLVLEGLFPLLSPGGWRGMFQKLLMLTDGQLRFVGAGFGCEVPGSMKATAQRFIGQSVVLGIRPQSIKLGASDQGLEFSLRVNVCEYLGTESVLSCSLESEANGVTLTAPGNHMGLINQMVPVHVSLESIYAFEPGEHGRSLGL